MNVKDKEEREEQKIEKKVEKKSKNLTKNISTKQAFIFGSVSIVAIVALGFAFVNFSVYKKLPLTVAKVNNHSIKFSQYNQEYNGYKFFMTKSDSADFNEEQAKKDVLSRLMINSIIDNLLLNYRGEVTQEEINAVLPGIFAERTEEEFFTLVKETYGWDRDDFLERVITPSLVQDELIKYITADKDLLALYGTGETEYKASHIFLAKSEDVSDEESKKILQDVSVRINEGASFEDFASTINKDQSINTGGDIGWFILSDLAPEFGAEVINLADQETSKNIIETEFGFHIIKNTGMRNKMDIDKYISEQIKAADVKVYWGFPNPLEDPSLE